MQNNDEKLHREAMIKIINAYKFPSILADCIRSQDGDKTSEITLSSGKEISFTDIIEVNPCDDGFVCVKKKTHGTHVSIRIADISYVERLYVWAAT